MRILIADPYRAVVGGAQTYQKALFAALRARGHELALLHDWPAGPEVDVVDGRDPHHARFCVGEIGVRAAREAVEAWRPDVVYSQGFGSDELEAALIRRYPTAFFAHAYYGTCATGTKHHARPDSRVCERVLSPACLVLNYTRGCGGLHPKRLLRSYRAETRHLGHVRAYGKVLVASRHMFREYARHGVPEARLERLPHFASIAADEVLAPPPPPSGVVLFTSRLTQLKGGVLLVEAIGQAERALGRGLRLVVVGDGPERGALEARARELRVNARFDGWLDTARVTAAMRGAELLAFPSIWPEPFGLVGIEAGGLGVPAVGFAVGGVVDWLKGGESGEIAPGDPPTASALADAIARALRDPEHYARLREGAWRIARTFTREAHVTRLEEILAEVVAAGVR